MTDPDQPLPLPGLDQPPRPPSPLEAAVRRTVTALRESDVLEEVNALDLELMLQLAQIVTDKARSGKTSTVNADARLLWEIRRSFITEADDTVNDQLRDAMAAWETAIGTTS